MVEKNDTNTVDSATHNQIDSSYDPFTPPSRARQFIQMKPKPSSNNTSTTDSDVSHHQLDPSSMAVTSFMINTNKTTSAADTYSKNKWPSTTRAAERKIARNAAHSIIERRRRMKMSEEFGVLKGMIPACEGVEMHKLAILQAGIEYMRYLKACVGQLKSEIEKRRGQDYRIRSKTGVREEEERVGLVNEEGEGVEGDLSDTDGEEMPDDESREEASNTRRDLGHNGLKLNEGMYRDSRNSSVVLKGISSYPTPHASTQQVQAIDRGILSSRPEEGPILSAGRGSFTSSSSQFSRYSTTAAPSSLPTSTIMSPAFGGRNLSPVLSGGRSNGNQSSYNGNATPSSKGTINRRCRNVNSGACSNMIHLPLPKLSMRLPLPHPPPTPLQICGYLNHVLPLDSEDKTENFLPPQAKRWDQ